MGIEKLIRKGKSFSNKRESIEDELIQDLTDALSTLQGENEKLRAELEQERAHRLHAEQHADAFLEDCKRLNAELGQVIAERGALIEDFVDYVTDGVPNPAIFCKNRCNKCVDMRGWCTGKNCNGFYPSGASGQKED